jgi:rubredoxin
LNYFEGQARVITDLLPQSEYILSSASLPSLYRLSFYREEETIRRRCAMATAVTTTKTMMKKRAASKKKVAGTRVKGKASKTTVVRRYRCIYCGYIYSPLRGEPHNGIPAGTEFEDLPETYVCPVCGYQGKGKIGKWGFEEWRPTRYICSVCGYVYDEARGEPHRGIKPGTKFEDLPKTYVCPVCALDPKLTRSFGKVHVQGFGPLDIA